MPRIKSLVIRSEIDNALKAHNCQGNASHRLIKNDIRLKVRNGRNWDHYCFNCATTMLKRDIEKLTKLAEQLQAD